MTNEDVDPKVMCCQFRRKFQIIFMSYEELMRIEGRFTTMTPVNNPEAAIWITSHVNNQPIDPISKILLLLKTHFFHWLSIESSENIHRLSKSTTGRITGLGYGGLTIYYSSDNTSYRNCIETHSCFNQLIFHVFIDLVKEHLSSYNDFRGNFNYKFNNKSLSCSMH